ncbi:MAG: folylpolyglutamate synthase/dihydrofolate synthase family protein [Acetivibrionales bacterium]|jgi:dihydrofolate synthase/folylpolyglutamate synthase|nr:folylpolyglutamate synthase/dihydrofolate synthase family protein [Bacillota bacterium]HOA54899.1 folylpolyglutamate synthase/dihydrofolate synthase family protein [Clostridiales bacterium]
MTYDEALAYIHGANRFGKKQGLRNIRTLLRIMGDPQKKLRFVHVAGTNGKGSTSAFIGSILSEAGYKTGIYTSPYVQRFTERIAMSSPVAIGRNTLRTEISRGELADITSFVRDCVNRMAETGENRPTEFEIVTAIAYEYYFRKRCDIVVLETGLGGRFDPTNVIDVPELAVITSIGMDHTERLGKTLAEIASEKAGIIKPGGDVLVYDQSPEVMQIFEDACGQRKAGLHIAGFSGIELREFGSEGQVFSYKGFRELKIPLIGRHQLRNAAVAVDAALLLNNRGYSIPEEAIRRGLENTRWPGRMEILSTDPAIIIDGAHNAEAAVVLKETLNEYFPGRPLKFIVGMAADKDYHTMLGTVLPGCKKVVAVTIPSIRALPADLLAKYASTYCNDVMISDTIEGALKIIMETARPEDVVCAFGSLYYIGLIRDMFGRS